MATILAHIQIRDGQEARFEALARTMYDATHANETGVRRYEYWRGEQPGTYYTLLAFDDHRSFITHQASDHHEDATAGLRDVIENIRLEWVDPIDGASPLPATDHQAALPDASELERRYAESYAAVVAGWWSPLR